jgi:D-glycero-D-manno-heptose 1,7-bisphosphate phosphatase
MKAVLLDREGTLIFDPVNDKVDTPEKVQLLPRTLEGLAYFAFHDFKAIIITNQTGIAQGRMTEEEFWKIHDVVLEQIEPSGIEVLKTYVCPHSPTAGCPCRKPQSYMLDQAIQEFSLKRNGTFMIGDRISDIEAGINANLDTILVETGKWPVTSEEATFTATDLLGAAQYIVANQIEVVAINESSGPHNL